MTRTLPNPLLPVLAALLASGLLVPGMAFGDEPLRRNGFVLEPSAVSVEEILSGGPPRDAIPALDMPVAVAAEAAPWSADDVVIGVVAGGKARAYPVRVLVWHELVNDELGGQPILVSYCPLCGTGLVFDRRVEAGPDAKPGRQEHRFGVSGLLYRSDLLMFDRASESLWSQISAEAVTGPLRGRRLTLLRSRMTRWADWLEKHPKTTVLARPRGTNRDYDRSPYGDYATSKDLMFPVPPDRRYHPKMPTLGLRIPGGAARAYPALELVRAGGRVEERFAGQPVRVSYDAEGQVFDFEAPAGVEVVEGFWFAWAAFHPGTSVFQGPAPAE